VLAAEVDDDRREEADEEADDRADEDRRLP
jgi:hypothetical protein